MKESAMRENTRIPTHSIAIVMLAIASLVAPAVYAQPNPNEPNHKEIVGRPGDLVGRIDLTGGPINRMLLVNKKHKEYLVAELGSSSGSSSNVALLDVTDPRHPRIIATPGSNAASSYELKIISDTLSLFGSKPAEFEATPKEIRHVPGITAFVVDKDHGLIYTAIGNQLWIVKTKLRSELDNAPDAATLYYGGGY
jgi:hypothetical protein